MSASMWMVMGAAILASLAVGVLLAHGMCMVMFRAFRIHARQIQAQRQVVPSEPVAVPQV